MTEEPFKNGISTWPALRQIQSLRDSIAWSLGGDSVSSNETISQWLAKNNMPPPLENSRSIGAISQSMMLYRKQLMKDYYVLSEESGTKSNRPSVDDFGSERGGAGWNKCDNFVITSAFIRLLGAWEQYELDVLKALFYYRPDGHPLGPPEEWTEKEVEEHVIREIPEPDPKDKNKLLYIKQPLWTWMVKHAENNEQRHKIFKNVFSIQPIFGSGEELKENNRNRKDWYDKRNKIAHGRCNVTMMLDEYVKCEVLVIRSILHLEDECREKQKLII